MILKTDTTPEEQEFRLRALALAVQAHPAQHEKSALDLAKQFHHFVQGEYEFGEMELKDALEKAKALVENLEKAKRLSRELDG